MDSYNEPMAASPRMSGTATMMTVVAAFGTYFCMYGFRKPFTVGTYQNIETLAGVSFKTVLVIAQVLGYMVSKFIGIRLIAETPPHRRVTALLLQIGAAELALLFFALTPAPYNAAWLFVNGLMLGMIFGLVMGFLEGRRNTEALLAALCASFILADGVVKTVGAWLLDAGVMETWMPFAAGLVFTLPLLICTAILNRTPPPSDDDVAARSERAPMTKHDRRRFLRRYGVGLGLIVFMYLWVTILRSVRADYAPEIWAGLGVTPTAGLFTRTEFAVALGTLVLFSGMVLIRSNRVAFFGALALAAAGLILTLLAVASWRAGQLGAETFMILLGFGLYLPYIAVHTTVFERFIALTRDRGTIGYLMYLADAFGYLGYVGVLLVREFTSPASRTDILPFFLQISVGGAIAGVGLLVLAALYFRRLRAAS